MALKIRVSPSEHRLRSVDDQPGLLGIAFLGEPGDATDPLRVRFHIDAQTQPDIEARIDALKAGGARGAIVENRMVDEDKMAAIVEIDVEDILKACAGDDEIRTIMALSAMSLTQTFETFMPRAAFEQIVVAAEFARDVRDAVLREVHDRLQQ